MASFNRVRFNRKSLKRLRFKRAQWLAVLAACLVSQAATADVFVLPENNVDLVGSISSVRSRYEDTLVDIARKHDLGYTEIVRANPGVDPWLPGEGTHIVLPTQFILPAVERRGIIINLPEMRIYYYPQPATGEIPLVITHPISIGRMNWATPLGQTHIIRKLKNPAWYPPESIRREHAASGRPLPSKVPAGPDNPLGRFALQLSIPGYLIHGTNKPSGVGMRITHGCLRMLPEDIETFFPQVPLNTPVRIINMPSKVGWLADRLYLEVHPLLDDDAVKQDEQITELIEMLMAATRTTQITADWFAARGIYARASGIPSPVSEPAKTMLPGLEFTAP